MTNQETASAASDGQLHEPGTLPLGPVLAVAAILVVAALVFSTYSCLRSSAGAGTFTAPVSQFPAGSVTYVAADHMYVIHSDDGAFSSLSEVEADQADRLAGCLIRYRPDLSSAGETGVFRDDCHGTLFNRAGVAIQGSAPAMQQHPVRAGKDTLVVDIKACMSGGDSPSNEPCRE